MKPFATISSFLFFLIALGHLIRIIVGSTVTVDDIVIPMWPSVVVVLVFGALSVLLWREAGH